MTSFTFSTSVSSFPSRVGSSPSTPLSPPTLPAKAFLSPSFNSKSSSLAASNLGFPTSISKSSIPEMATQAKQRALIFETEEMLSVSLANYIADLSKKFAKDRGVFTVVLSGGQLIASLKKLLEPRYIDSIEWDKWHVFWVDERVVPKSNVESHYKLAFDGFLSKVTIPRDNVHAINDALSPQAAADDYEINLKMLVKSKVLNVSKDGKFPKFDLMLLGIGAEGQVASLFPGHSLVKEDKRWVSVFTENEKPGQDRITFTLPVINASENIAMVVAEETNANALSKVLGSDRSSASNIPAAMVAPEGEIAWFTDKETAPKVQAFGAFKKAEFEL